VEGHPLTLSLSKGDEATSWFDGLTMSGTKSIHHAAVV